MVIVRLQIDREEERKQEGKEKAESKRGRKGRIKI